MLTKILVKDINMFLSGREGLADIDGSLIFCDNL